MTDTPLDAGHLYVHSGYWPREEPWTPAKGYCRHAVHQGGRMVGFHQCGNKGKVTRRVDWKGEVQDVLYCGVHDPVKVAERKAKADAKAEEERVAWRARVNRKIAQREALEVVAAIAGGHNDPRTLCTEFLAKHGLI